MEQPEGDFLARQMERLSQLIRWTGATSPEITRTGWRSMTGSFETDTMIRAITTALRKGDGRVVDDPKRRSEQPDRLLEPKTG